MANCNDCWCEYYDKSIENCDKCVKNEPSKDKPDSRIILKRRTVKQIDLDKKNKSKNQER